MPDQPPVGRAEPRVALICVADAEVSEQLSLMLDLHRWRSIVGELGCDPGGRRPTLIFVGAAAELEPDDMRHSGTTVWVGSKTELMANRTVANEHGYRLTVPIDIAALEEIIVAHS